MKRFRKKLFSGKGNLISFVKSPQGLLTTAALGVSGANLTTNVTRHVNDRSYQKQQLKAMDNLSGNLGKFNQTLEETRRQQERLADILREANNLQKSKKAPESKKHWLFRFRRKE